MQKYITNNTDNKEEDKKQISKKISRRKFLKIIAWGSFWSAVVTMFGGTLRFFYPNVTYEQASVFKAGYPNDYYKGISTKWVDSQKIFIVKEEKIIYALLAVCTHLGCILEWSKLDTAFKCNCHGSGFYSSGINFEGPAPRALSRVKISFDIDGQILIDKNKLFVYEKGEWINPDSFINI